MGCCLAVVVEAALLHGLWLLMWVARHMLTHHGFAVLWQMLDWSAQAAQEAWNVTNDSLRTTLCVRFKAQVVACGILFLAARRLKVRTRRGAAFP